VTAAGVALYRRANTARSVAVVLLFVIWAPGVAIYVTPFGPVGLAFFIVALLLVMRTAAAPATPVAPMAGQPGAA
jgi:hypothetical protein